MLTIIVDEYRDNLPMNLIDKILEELKYDSQCKVIQGIDNSYMNYVYFTFISRVTKTGLYSDLTGRGYSYKEACIDLIFQLLDNNFNLRLNCSDGKDGYATERVRRLIEESKFKEYYFKT